MAKRKTSVERKSSSLKLMEHDYSKTLRDPKLVREALILALVENDLETFQDILVAHLRTVSKQKLSAETEIGRQTLYDLIDPEKPFNPTISTLGPLLKAMG